MAASEGDEAKQTRVKEPKWSGPRALGGFCALSRAGAAAGGGHGGGRVLLTGLPPSLPRRRVLDPPKSRQSARLEVRKEGQVLDVLRAGKKRFAVLGRNGDVCDFLLEHPSISRQHAAIGYDQHGSLYVRARLPPCVPLVPGRGAS